MLTKILLLFIIVQTNSSRQFVCSHLFHEEYLLFNNFYPEFFANREYLSINYQGEKLNGIVITKFCEQVEVPSECESEVKKAKIIFKIKNPKKDQKKCLIWEPLEWNWSIVEEDKEKNQNQEIKVSNLAYDNDEENESAIKPIKSISQDMNFEYKFTCDQKQKERKFKFNYDEQRNVLVFEKIDDLNCGNRLKGLQILDQYNIFSGIFFVLSGIFLCFFGFKIYADGKILFGLFLGVLVCILFYVLFCTEANDSQSLIYMIILFGALIVLLMFFEELVAIFATIFISIYLTIVVIFNLSSQYEFAHQTWFFYVVYFILVLGILFFYFLFREFIIIGNTAFFGSFLILSGLHYLNLYRYDFLFEQEFSNIYEYKNYNSEQRLFMILLAGIFAVGFIIQVVFFYKKLDSEVLDDEEEYEQELQSNDQPIIIVVPAEQQNQNQ